jgi:arabinose-5-phosphate isomerase
MLRNLFSKQKQYLDYFFERIDIDVAEHLLEKIHKLQGNLVFTGVGKSGQVAKKLVSTFVSLGTKSVFIHPTEALHGDLGIISKNDIVVFLSKSGNSAELIDLAKILHERSVYQVAWTCKQEGQLSRYVDLVCLLPLQRELCAHNLSPTTSPILQMCYGDILAVGLMQLKQFSLDSYAENHPSGFIGVRSKLVQNVMIPVSTLPLVAENSLLKDALVLMSQKRLGCVLVVDSSKNLKGIFTTGDLNRALCDTTQSPLEKQIQQFMTTNFSWISSDERVDSALNLMQNPDKRIQVLPVIDAGVLVGLLHLYDILGNVVEQTVVTI